MAEKAAEEGALSKRMGDIAGPLAAWRNRPAALPQPLHLHSPEGQPDPGDSAAAGGLQRGLTAASTGSAPEPSAGNKPNSHEY